MQLSEVYQRKTIAIDYRLVLSTSIAAYFSKSNGDPMVHLSSQPMLAENIFGMGFPKETPWLEVFNEKIGEMQQAGWGGSLSSTLKPSFVTIQIFKFSVSENSIGKFCGPSIVSLFKLVGNK